MSFLGIPVIPNMELAMFEEMLQEDGHRQRERRVESTNMISQQYLDHIRQNI